MAKQLSETVSLGLGALLPPVQLRDYYYGALQMILCEPVLPKLPTQSEMNKLDLFPSPRVVPVRVPLL